MSEQHHRPSALRRLRRAGRRFAAASARWLPYVAMVALVALAVVAGALAPLDRFLGDQRLRVIDRPASGDIVVVQIDPRSIAELGVWPWPRDLHARVIDRLARAGASEIAVDVDFSSRMSGAGDRALAEALERVGQRVILPVFRQLATPDGSSPVVHDTAPLAMFRQHVQLGGVNLSADPDGLVREMTTTQAWRDRTVATLPALLAGPVAIELGRFGIDFGIRPDSLARHSFVDVLRGEVPDAAFAGRRVILGNAASELGDQHAVPVHRRLHGPTIQALAYESLIQGRALREVSGEAVILGAALLILVLGPMLTRLGWRAGGALALWAAVAVEGGGYAVQAMAPVVLPSAGLLAAIGLCYGHAVARRLDLQSILLFRQRMEMVHRRQLMQRVLEDSFDGVAIADAGGRIQAVNRTACELLGYAPAELRGAALDQVAPEFSSGMRALEADAAPEGAPAGDGGAAGATHVGPLDLVLRRRDGTPLRVELVVSRCFAQPSQRLHERRRRPRTIYSYTFRDVSERARALQAQRDAAKEALAASRAKSEFLANMSHELRTPLNAIIGFSELMKEQSFGPLAQQYADYAADIHDSGHHLLRVINDILDVSKIESGRFALTETSVDVGELLRGCLRIAGGWPETARRKLRVDVGHELPRLRADSQLVKQSVINLLSNAVKYSHDGDRVELRAVRERSGALVLEVADTGIGIPEEHLDSLGTPFQQVDGSLSRRHQGSGLGLALVSAYMRAHGGEMSVRSRLGVGTTVRLRFPAARVGEAAAFGVPPPPSPPATAADTGGPTAPFAEHRGAVAREGEGEGGDGDAADGEGAEDPRPSAEVHPFDPTKGPKRSGRA